MTDERSAGRAAARRLITDPRSGGLNGLIERFAACGIEHIAESWIGNGPNLPVSPQELRSAIGDERVAALAAEAGVPVGALLTALCRHLPAVVDRLTPEGMVPPGGLVEAAGPAG